MIINKGDVVAQQFNKSKEKYRLERENQKDIIAEMLRKSGYEVSNHWRSGKGIKNYSSGGYLSKPYDLRNWIWVTGKSEINDEITIYLQSFDQDPSSKNYHILFDRLSVQFGNSEPITTEIDLPLSEHDLTKLEDLIKEIKLSNKHQKE